MTGDTTGIGAPPTMSRVYCYTVEYGPWMGCVQHARAHAIVVAAPPGGGRGLPAGRPAVRRLLSQPTSAWHLALCTAGFGAGRVAAGRRPRFPPKWA